MKKQNGDAALKAGIRAGLEWGDVALARRILEESGVKNPKTGKPYGYQTLQRHLLGLMHNPPLWAALEQIAKSREKDAQRVRQHLQQKRPNPGAALPAPG
jgi:hypothetical protein